MNQNQKKLCLVLIVLSFAASLGVPRAFCEEECEIAGIVLGSGGRPIYGASVRIKATPHSVHTDVDGRFLIAGVDPPARNRVTAWKEGHYVAGVDASPCSADVKIPLASYPSADRPDYRWMAPSVPRTPLKEWSVRAVLSMSAAVSIEKLFLPVAKRLNLGCRDCHAETVHDQWAGSAHALGAGNPRFLSMYNGTDLAGNRSEATRFGYSRDYGSFPLRPDPGRPYFGPGYKLDFPKTKGNCGSCHLPGAAANDPYGVDPNTVTGADAQGVHCDFCHKISGVRLDRATGRPRENMPGVLSIELTRPPPGEQVFFGPYDDVDAGPDTYLPLMKESAVCAPCHQASFWGVPIYQSFAEWQESSYPERGITCQHCHMRPDGVMTNFAPRRGGVERDPSTLASHNFPGAADEALMRSAVELEATAERQDGKLLVRVSVTNDNTGHHVPTDSPLRQLILLVNATGDDDAALPLLEGGTVPGWGGIGDPGKGRYAGLPGKGFAKILEETWTGIRPTGAYWNATRIHSDNRVPAGASDISTYVFSDPGKGSIRVGVRLLYRRAFLDLMEQKGWDVPDILMAERSVVIPDRGKEMP